MNTRYHDLAHLEEGRDRRGYESKHARRLIERVHKMSQDDVLEKMRRALIDAQKRNDYQEIKKLTRALQERQRRYGR